MLLNKAKCSEMCWLVLHFFSNRHETRVAKFEVVFVCGEIYIVQDPTSEGKIMPKKANSPERNTKRYSQCVKT